MTPNLTKQQTILIASSRGSETPLRARGNPP